MLLSDGPSVGMAWYEPFARFGTLVPTRPALIPCTPLQESSAVCGGQDRLPRTPTDGQPPVGPDQGTPGVALSQWSPNPVKDQRNLDAGSGADGWRMIADVGFDQPTGDRRGEERFALRDRVDRN